MTCLEHLAPEQDLEHVEETPEPAKSKFIQVLSDEKFNTAENPVINHLYESVYHSRLKLKELQDENQMLKQELKKSQQNTRQWKTLNSIHKSELEKIDKNLSNYFGPAQREIINGKKKVRWDIPTLEKTAALKANVGDRNLEMLGKNFFPTPTPRTLRLHLSEYKFKPGTQEVNMKVLKRKVDVLNLAHYQKKMLIGFDEKSIVPGVKYDPSIRERIGYATLDPTAAQKSKNPSQIATHGQLYLALGLNPRFKETLGYDFTSNSTDPAAMKKRLFTMIIQAENETGLEVMGLIMDMGPTNLSFLKYIGIVLSKVDPVCFVPHPNDSSRKLFMFADPVHILKNLTCAIRNHSLLFSQAIVEQHNLSSSMAKFQDILDLHEKQKDQDVKFAPKLTHQVIFPSNFEKMQENIAYDLISPEVTQGLDIIFEDSEKKNPTAFFLEVLHRLKMIFTSVDGWSRDEWNKYQDDLKFLNYLIKDFFPNIRFVIARGSVKSIEGAILSLTSLIGVANDLFDCGNNEVYPKHFTNNAVENRFSDLTMTYQKPDAKQFKQGLRGSSIKNFHKPTKGSSYMFNDADEASSINFLSIIKEHGNKSIIENEDEVYEIVQIELPNFINDIELFPIHINRFGFHKSIANLILQNIGSCKICARCFQSYDLIKDSEGHFTLTTDSLNFFCLLEHCFRLVKSQVPLNNKHFDETFKLNSSGIQACNHCPAIQDLFIEKFLQYRLKISHPSRDKHNTNRFSSKSLSK